MVYIPSDMLTPTNLYLKLNASRWLVSSGGVTDCEIKREEGGRGRMGQNEMCVLET